MKGECVMSAVNNSTKTADGNDYIDIWKSLSDKGVEDVSKIDSFSLCQSAAPCVTRNQREAKGFTSC